LKLLALVCSNEWQFAAIKEKNFLEKIQVGIEKNAELQKPSVKLSHIQLLHAISQHSIGLHWLKQTRSWKLCIDYYQSSNTIFIIRETGNFLFTVLTKFSELMKDEKLCVEIIDTIMAPVINFRGKDEEVGRASMVVDDYERSREIAPCLNIVNHLLTLCIESNKRSRMAYYILLKNRYENKIWQIADLYDRNTDFLTIILKGLHLANFARLSSMDIPASDANATDIPFDVHTIHFYNMMLTCVVKRLFKAVNMIAEMHHVLWHKLGDRAPPETVLEHQDLKYGDQVIMIQTLPLVYIIKSHYKGNREYITDICTKMFDKSCEHTIRLLYQYRDALALESFEFVADLAANSIQKIVSLKNFLNRERATLALQILIHVLQGYVDDPSGATQNGKGKKVCNIQLVLQAPNLLSTLLVGLNEMIKFYNFMWKECIESTTIASLLLVLLDNPNLSARVS
jgi:BRCA1-associated ATM activator 1